VLPICLAVGWMATSGGHPSPRAWYALSALLLWFARYNFFFPWDGWTTGIHSEDWRYGEIARATGSGSPLYWLVSFTSLHQTPTLLVWFALSPALPAWAAPATAAPPLGIWDLLAAGTMALAILIQASADADLRAFRRQAYGPAANLMTAAGSKSVCRHGLWNYSRHPNYFGEWLFWVGVALLGVAAESSSRPWLARWGGACGMFLFFRVSAMLMDRRMMKHRPAEFHHEMRCTSALIPRPRFR
jgi:steroid 5-alpha reductase family enzyme